MTAPTFEALVNDIVKGHLGPHAKAAARDAVLAAYEEVRGKLAAWTEHRDTAPHDGCECGIWWDAN